ncbi:hypothetical protein GCM10009733_087100 [Nonomuraea maheshkhaliensis]|uniref:Uncharacterized protein n=1 Tax=Nonomuraea maheshkhaliensis TaxID=419590 RepID=A0ABP4SVQ0_9ACTN
MGSPSSVRTPRTRPLALQGGPAGRHDADEPALAEDRRPPGPFRPLAEEGEAVDSQACFRLERVVHPDEGRRAAAHPRAPRVDDGDGTRTPFRRVNAVDAPWTEVPDEPAVTLDT